MIRQGWSTVGSHQSGRQTEGGHRQGFLQSFPKAPSRRCHSVEPPGSGQKPLPCFGLVFLGIGAAHLRLHFAPQILAHVRTNVPQFVYVASVNQATFTQTRFTAECSALEPSRMNSVV